MIENSQAFVPPKPLRFTPDQFTAIEDLLKWTFSDRSDPIRCLTGPAGTGKTTLMRALESELSSSYKTIAWSALTGKAAHRLRESAGVSANTLHSILYYPPTSDSSNELTFSQVRSPDGINQLVIDEASMMTPSIMEDLKKWINLGVKILLVGDSFQLPPVISSNEEKKYGKDYSVFNEYDGPSLSTIVRSDDGIITVATELRENGTICKDPNESYTYNSGPKVISEAIDSWLKDPDDHVMITWTNKLRSRINETTRARLKIIDPRPQEGEPILICSNGQTCLNGEIYTVEEVWDGPNLVAFPSLCIKVKGKMEPLFVAATGKESYLDGGMPYIKDWRNYKNALKVHNKPQPLSCTFGYAVTAHKAQGSEFRRVSVLLSNRDLNNEHFCVETTLPSGKTATIRDRWIYTAVTRAKKKLSINIV